MKLFKVYVIDDTEEYLELVVADCEEEAREKVKNLKTWSCFICATAIEVEEIDGYKIILQPIDIEED